VAIVHAAVEKPVWKRNQEISSRMEHFKYVSNLVTSRTSLISARTGVDQSLGGQQSRKPTSRTPL